MPDARCSVNELGLIAAAKSDFNSEALDQMASALEQITGCEGHTEAIRKYLSDLKVVKAVENLSA